MAIQVITIPLDSANWEKATSPTGYEQAVNIIYGISTPFGSGIEVNTTGRPEYGFDFYMRTKNSIQVPSDGKLNLMVIVNYYDTSDTLGVEDQVRYARLYVLDTSGNILKTITILKHKYDSLKGNMVNKWYPIPVSITGLTPGSQVKIGLGRRDAWSYDYQLTLKVAMVTIHNLV